MISTNGVGLVSGFWTSEDKVRTVLQVTEEVTADACLVSDFIYTCNIMPTVTPHLGSGSCFQYLPTCTQFRARYWHRSLASMRSLLACDTGGGAVLSDLSSCA